jgi:hypothetical protein
VEQAPAAEALRRLESILKGDRRIKEEIGGKSATRIVPRLLLDKGSPRSICSLGLVLGNRYPHSVWAPSIQKWVVEKGGKVGPGGFRTDIFLPVLGSTATGRDLSYNYIPLYYSERFRSSGQLIVLVKDGDGKLFGLWRGGEGRRSYG